MTRDLAHKHGLDLFCFSAGKAAVAFALEGHEAVAVFEETIAHFTVFFVAVRPRPGEHKFTRAG